MHELRCPEHPDAVVRRCRTRGVHGHGIYPRCLPTDGAPAHVLSWEDAISAAPLVETEVRLAVAPSATPLTPSELAVLCEAANGLHRGRDGAAARQGNPDRQDAALQDPAQAAGGQHRSGRLHRDRAGHPRRRSRPCGYDALARQPGSADCSLSEADAAVVRRHEPVAEHRGSRARSSRGASPRAGAGSGSCRPRARRCRRSRPRRTPPLPRPRPSRGTPPRSRPDLGHRGARGGSRRRGSRRPRSPGPGLRRRAFRRAARARSPPAPRRSRCRAAEHGGNGVEQPPHARGARRVHQQRVPHERPALPRHLDARRRRGTPPRHARARGSRPRPRAAGAARDARAARTLARSQRRSSPPQSVPSVPYPVPSKTSASAGSDTPCSARQAAACA